MTESNEDLTLAQIISLITSYSFDTNQYSVETIVRQWQKQYRVHWIYLATIEALYLGRYKAISIEQILNGWYRRGQPNTHFNGDFERVISRKLPRHLSTSDPGERSHQQQLSDRYNSKQNPSVALSEGIALNDGVSRDDNTQKPIIATDVTVEGGERMTPLAKRQISSPPSLELSTEIDERSHSKKIVPFQPTSDASSFFQKLKALADNQRQQEG